MLRLPYIFFIVLFIFVRSRFYGLNTAATPNTPSPSMFTVNSLNHHWYERKVKTERNFGPYDPFGLLKIVVISIIFIFLFYIIFCHLCITVRYVTCASQ